MSQRLLYPSVADIFASQVVKDSFQKAWDDSFPTPETCREQGGFIYADGEGFRTFHISWAPPGAMESQSRREIDPTKSLSINLTTPILPDSASANAVLVATFHTHPLSPDAGGNEHPSNADMDNAYYRRMPGFVVSRSVLYYYNRVPGDEESDHRRRKTDNPNGYPRWAEGEFVEPQGAFLAGKIKWRPTSASNQRD
ncbi:hypothetical protein H0H81_010435 [Sphagnurus paluster]|uniref:JAB domain-containing protein n=1 Tax=Sphagnurus paluster TaxID=117069 RepID=A0A9P7FV53_9AGAR|nr:hypothetical protein H0H81_010435 [Sphagnurus paluster]